MKLRFLLAAALLGGLVAFAWGSISHMAMVFPSIEPKSFSDSTAVVETVRAHAPTNGIYFDGRGLFAAVAFRSDLSDKYEDMLYPLIHQFLIEVAVTLVLGWLLLRMPLWTPFGTGSVFGMLGLAAGIEQLLPEANWYGFPLRFQFAEMADLVIGWFLLGLLLGWLRRKFLGGESAAGQQ